ncbi:hypothetical protein Tco_1187470 [Tanacetum coccineum]
MDTTKAQQIALADALVAPANRLKIGKCNHRLSSTLKSNKPTIQVVLDALKLTPFYKEFQITANICPRLLSQKFEDPPLKEEILSFIRDLGHTRKIKVLTDVNVNHMHYPGDHLLLLSIGRPDEPVTSSKSKTAPASKGSKLKSPAKVAKTNKKKQPATMQKTKGLDVLSEVALTEAGQIKLATKRSKTQFHRSHASGSGDGVDTQLKVPDKQQQKDIGTYEGVGDKPEVPDVPKYNSESDEESWTFSQDEEDADEETNMNDDSDESESDNDGDDLTHPNLSTYKADDEEEEQEKTDDEEIDVNINLERSDDEMTDAEANKDTEDAHFINPSPDIESKTTTTTIPTTTLPDILNFASLFWFEQRVSALETEMSEFKQTNQFANVVSSISGIVDNYLASKMKDAVDVAVQLQTNKLREEAQAENHEFLNQVDSTMKAIIKEQVQAHVSNIMPKIEKYVTESLGAEVLVRSTNQP